MPRRFAGAFALLFFASMCQAQGVTRFDDYGAARRWAEDHSEAALVIAFQQEGQPAIPAEALGNELAETALVELPLDVEHSGKKLIDDAAFAGLGAQPGFALGEFVDGQLRITATLPAAQFDAASFAATIVKPMARQPRGYVPLMSAEAVDAVKRLLPSLADAQLRQVIDDPHTMWYDDQSMPSAYQDVVPPFVGILATRLSGNVAPVEFFENGKFRFPFGHPGGLHRAVGVEGVNFILLPADGDDRRPVVWWKEGDSYHWSFPIGTILGEILMQRMPQGDEVVFEIRVRRRQKNSWHANAHRPFPTAESLADAVMEYDSCWDQDPQLAALVSHLRDSNTLQPRELRDTYGGFFAKGATDELPPIRQQIVTDLLRNATFSSSEGAVWKSNDELECFAPTATTYSVVPVNYDAGLIAVHEISCNRCHQHTGKMIGEFVPSQQLYGQVWGSDGTFSWHPFDPGQLLSSPNGLAASPLRGVFVKQHVIEAYDTAKHSSRFYNVLPELRRGQTMNISF